MAATDMLRIALASPSPLVRAGLASGLAALGDCDVVMSAATLAELVDARCGGAEVVVVDAGDDEGELDVAVVAAAGPHVILLAGDGDERIGEWLIDGCPVLPRGAAAAQVAAAARAALAGLVATSPGYAAEALRFERVGARRGAAPGFETLTPRERQVLAAMSNGLGNREIGGALGISAHTAKFHVAQIIAKLQAQSRAHAVAKALRAGFVDAWGGAARASRRAGSSRWRESRAAAENGALTLRRRKGCSVTTTQQIASQASAYVTSALSSPTELFALFAAAVAGGLQISSSFVKTMVPLRWLAVLSNCGFLVYGVLHPSFVMALMHGILLPINCVRLREMSLLSRRVHAATNNVDRSGIWLRPYMRSSRRKAGEVLFRRGDPAEHLYILVEGRVDFPEVNGSVTPGEIFGEIAFFSPDRKRTLTACCGEDCVLLSIDQSTVRQLYYQHPAFGFEIVGLIAGRLTADVARLRAQLAEQPPA